jgi:EmrB/QacA subfamily drug resistance transporter
MNDSRSPAPAGQSPPRAGLILLACCVGQLLVVLDSTIMNVALPVIQGALHFDANSLQWVINAFTVPMAGLLLLSGRMVDLFSRRAIFLSGVAVFTIGSLLGGLAGNATLLIVARAAQGVGMAMVAPATLSVLSTTFTEPKARAKAFGLWGAAAGSGGALGVLAGGIITDWLSWRWVLLVNVPVGIGLFIVAAMSITTLPAHPGRRRLDVAGAVAVTLGIAAVVFGIAQGGRSGWDSPATLISLGLGVVALAFFVYDQARLAEQPLVPLSIFRNRSVAAGNLALLCVGAAMVSTFYFLTLLMQVVLHYSPLRTGLAYLPLSVSTMLGATVLAGVLGRFGTRIGLLAGQVVAIVGLVWLSFAGADATYVADLLGPSVVFGIGVGLMITTAANAATAGVEERQQGLASGLVTVSQTVGAAAGLAVLVGIANSHTADLAAGGMAPPEALAAGYDRGFIAAAVLLGLGFIAATLTPKKAPVAPQPAEDAREREKVRAGR